MLFPRKKGGKIKVEIEISRQSLYNIQRLFLKILMFIPNDRARLLEALAYLAGLLHQTWLRTYEGSSKPDRLDTSI